MDEKTKLLAWIAGLRLPGEEEDADHVKVNPTDAFLVLRGIIQDARRLLEAGK